MRDPLGTRKTLARSGIKKCVKISNSARDATDLCAQTVRCAHEKPGRGARVVCWFSGVGSGDDFDGRALIEVDHDDLAVIFAELEAVEPELFVA